MNYRALGVAILLAALAGCATGDGGGDNHNGNSNSNTNHNGNGNTNANANSNDNAGANDNGTPSGMPFAEINGTEEMVEGSRSQSGNGDSRQRDERFTANWSIMPTSAEEAPIFINNQPSTKIFGDIAGQAILTYEESGTDVTAELECPTTTYSGNVSWNTTITGSYDYIPALGTITLTTHATNVSSTPYTVTFTTPGCPDQDSENESQYEWGGPGQGVWGFVDIVLENGHFEHHKDNVLEDDLGAQDFYNINVNVGASQPPRVH